MFSMWDFGLRSCIDVEVGAPKRGAGPHRNDQTQVARGATVSKHAYVIHVSSCKGINTPKHGNDAV